ncbi:MAG: phospholipase D-like domain-containing protein [Pseudomonadota bacterium]
MDALLFQPLVEDWGDRVSWTQTQREKAAGLLRDISVRNRGEIVEDVQIDPALVADHAARQAIGPLDRYAKRVARDMVREPVKAELNAAGADLLSKSLQLKQWTHKLDINAANSDELEALPEIGPVLARRIIARRVMTGRLRNLEDLDTVPGIGEAALSALENRVFFGERLAAPLRIASLDGFLETPTFPAFVTLLADADASFALTSAPSPSAYLLDVLAEVSDEIKETAFIGSGLPEGVRASVVIARHAARQRKVELDEAAADADYVAPLFSRAYGRVALSLIQRATVNLDIALFFFFYVADRNHPTDELMEALIAAHNRGVAVRVILDQDQPGDPFHSRQINDAAFKALTATGIPVRFDQKDRLMHGKVLIADSKETIIGSHNFTAGSLRQYHDTSCYVESELFAEQSKQWFETLWASIV